MKTKDELRKEFDDSFDNAPAPLTLGERLMMKAAWDTAWNLATAQANGVDLKLEQALPINCVIDCSTCKHQKVSKYVEPCYGCRDNDGYGHYESAIGL